MNILSFLYICVTLGSTRPNDLCDFESEALHNGLDGCIVSWATLIRRDPTHGQLPFRQGIGLKHEQCQSERIEDAGPTKFMNTVRCRSASLRRHMYASVCAPSVDFAHRHHDVLLGRQASSCLLTVDIVANFPAAHWGAPASRLRGGSVRSKLQVRHKYRPCLPKQSRRDISTNPARRITIILAIHLPASSILNDSARLSTEPSLRAAATSLQGLLLPTAHFRAYGRMFARPS